MTTENTLNVDLNQRVLNSPRFKASTVSEYFRNNSLDWWKPKESPYLTQEFLIKKWLEGKRFKKGLEIGPGFGRITDIIAPRVERLTLVEINRKAIRSLEIKFSQAKILKVPAEKYADWRGRYGIIAAVEVLVHIPNLPELLDMIAESLEKGGLFITSITSDNFYKKKHTIIHRGINQKEFENALSQRQFKVDEKVQNKHLLTYLLKKKF